MRRSILGRIALTVALSLGATGALVAVQSPAFAGVAGTNCHISLLEGDGVGIWCFDGPSNQFRAGIFCEADSHHYSYWRLGPWVNLGSQSRVYCYSPATEHRVAYLIDFGSSPGPSA